MMIVPDVNLLVYAYDSTAPSHHLARRWWEDTLSGEGPVGIAWIVILAFVRLMTHPTLCQNPMTVAQARRCVETWLELDHVLLLSPKESTCARFFDLLEGVGTGGNLSTDALIAAHALEFGGTVCSNDLDFRRFPGLQLQNPLDPSA